METVACMILPLERESIFFSKRLKCMYMSQIEYEQLLMLML